MTNTQQALTPLTIGEKVRVFKTHSSSTLWLRHPGPGKSATLVPEGVVEGTVSAIRADGELARVDVVRDGRELYVNFTARHWIRRLDEPAPHNWQENTLLRPTTMEAPRARRNV